MRVETESSSMVQLAGRKGSGRRVLISIPTGFQLRQFVHSGVLELLLEQGCRVVIVSPNREGEGFTSHLPPGVDLYALTVHVGRLRERYFQARQHLLCHRSPTDTLRQKMLNLRKRYRWTALAAQAGGHLLRAFPALRGPALNGERVFFHDRQADALFCQEPIDLVLLGSPGYVPQDAVLLHAAAKYKVPTVAAILSWDNLSSKGLINPMPDRLLVWSDHMRREAIEMQGIPGDRIIETGTVVHDAFANTGRFGSRSENLRRLGLDPARKLIFYGTNHGGFFPDEIEVVRQVARWVEQDALGMPCQLWVRLHPQVVTGPFSVPTAAYRELSSSRVRIEFPPVREANMLWDLPQADLDHLVGLLRDADVVINSGSLSIDSAILDRPVLCIAYDPAGDVPYERSTRRFYDFTHMAHVVRSGAVRLATSPDDLSEKISAYLENPALDREGRRRIVEQQFGKVDGASAYRMVDAILSMFEGRSADSAEQSLSFTSHH